MEKLHPVYFHVSLNILYNYTPFLDQQYITFPRVNELLVKYTGSRDVFSVESSRQWFLFHVYSCLEIKCRKRTVSGWWIAVWFPTKARYCSLYVQTQLYAPSSPLCHGDRQTFLRKMGGWSAKISTPLWLLPRLRMHGATSILTFHRNTCMASSCRFQKWNEAHKKDGLCTYITQYCGQLQ